MSFSFANLFRGDQSSVRSLPANEAVKMADKGEITLIDARDQSEITSTGKAKGAIHIPLFMLERMTDPHYPEFHPDLKTDKAVAIYCATGARSQMAGHTMDGFGFTEVYNIGGLVHWQAAGGASES